jgi:ankyrin repeat protein
MEDFTIHETSYEEENHDIEKRIQCIETLQGNTTQEKLTRIHEYVKLIFERQHDATPPSPRCCRHLIRSIAPKVVLLLENIASQLKLLDVAFVYFLFGRVLLDRFDNDDNNNVHGTICLHQSLTLLGILLPDIPYPNGDDHIRLLEALQYMLKHIDINQEQLSMSDTSGNTLLHLVGTYGDKYVPIAKVCIDKGIDTETQNKDGRTALLLANRNDCLEVVTYLIEHGAAKIQAESREKRTALHFASAMNNLSIVTYLVEHGVNIEKQDSEGWTALIYASNRGRYSIVKYLIENGAKVDGRRFDGYAAIHVVSKYGYIDIVKCLVENGASLENCDDDGITALHVAVRNNNVAVVQYLCENGANMNAKNKKHMHALL